MPSHAAIGIHDDLASGQAGIAHRTADNKTTGWVDINLGVLIHQFRRNDSLDHVFQNVRLNAIVADFFVIQLVGVLAADNDSVDANRLAVVIFHGYLALAIGVHPGQGAILADFRHAAGQLVGVVDGHRHQGFGFIAGKAKHHALVASASGFDESFVVFDCFLDAVLVHTARNIRALVGQRHQHTASGAVEALLAAVVADVVDHFAHEGIDVNIGLGGHFAVGQHEAGLDGCLAGNPAGFIFRDHGIQDRVADLVAHLIGMTFGDRFRSEQVLG